MLLVLVEQGLERVDGRAGLRNNLRKDLDVNCSALENVVIFDEVGEPSFDLWNAIVQ